MLTVDRIDLFYGAAQALRSVSIKAETGRILTVLGRNGVGKSSLLRAIVGQHMVASGAIRWNDDDVTRLPSHAAREGRLRLRAAGPRDLPAAHRAREPDDRLRRAETLRARHRRRDFFALSRPRGHAEAGRGGDLSGGQQQQLAIARALVTRPKLLILDEPTEGIQPSIIKDIGRALVHLRRKGDMAILVVEQYFEWARDICDDYAVMDRGVVVLSGTRQEMSEADVRARMTV